MKKTTIKNIITDALSVLRGNKLQVSTAMQTININLYDVYAVEIVKVDKKYGVRVRCSDRIDIATYIKDEYFLECKTLRNAIEVKKEVDRELEKACK